MHHSCGPADAISSAEDATYLIVKGLHLEQEISFTGASKTNTLAANQPALFVEVKIHQGYLLRFATAKLRDTEQAGEVVQEALLAALDAIDSFSGQSTLSTWLTSVLKFKNIEFQRRVVAERAHLATASKNDDSGDPDWFDRIFDDTGHWQPRLSAWANPDSALKQKPFFEVFERCMDKLPTAASRGIFQTRSDGVGYG